MVTIHEVAQRAGVTKSTVSNVLTGKVPVKEATRKKILAAIEELGYQPNLMARGLKQGKTFSIALVIPKLSNPFYAEVVESIEQTCAAHDYKLVLCMTDFQEARIKKHLHSLSIRSIDGLILYSPTDTDLQHLSTFADKEFPIVLAGWDYDTLNTPHFPILNFDFRATGALATRHLLELGHTSIGIILVSPPHTLRLQGMLDMLHQMKLPLYPDYIRYGDSEFRSGYQQARDLLSLPKPPTAIFATNDLMALGALQAAHDLNIQVPQQLSLIGVDNIETTEYSYPPLTTVSLPKRDLGRALVEYLLRIIADSSNSHKPNTTTLFHPELIVRGTTAPPSLALPLHAV